MVNIDPQKYNLSSRIALQEDESKNVFIKINRKSRIVMKDGHRILEIVKKIKQIEKQKNIGVLSQAPICSKTKMFLNKNGVSIQKT